MHLCFEMVQENLLSELPKERIFEELKKLLLKAEKPSLGVRLMQRLGVFRHFSELEGMSAMTCHSQNDIFNHTVMTLDQMASMKSGDERHQLIMMLAILCHKMPQGGRTFLEKLTNESKLIEKVVTLVSHNRLPQKMFERLSCDYEIVHLATKVTLSDLIQVAQAIDLKCHRHTPDHTFEAGAWLTQQAQRLHVFSAPLEPLLQGRDLIAMGLEPSPHFTTLLEAAYDAQMHQKFTCKTEALTWLQAYISKQVFY
jgi:tRNA nucleotidyltransferase (CCA-adding enzyme)